MEIRPITPHDLNSVADIDGTIESAEYLHLDQSGEGLSIAWKLEKRPLRQKLIQSNPLTDEDSFAAKQIATSADEGFALVADHEGAPVALLVAQTDHTTGALHIIDMRVDYDHRRQGLATAMIYQVINRARELEMRAVSAEVSANNLPANQLLLKCAFDL